MKSRRISISIEMNIPVDKDPETAADALVRYGMGGVDGWGQEITDVSVINPSDDEDAG
jgi:hypothetical protein